MQKKNACLGSMLSIALLFGSFVYAQKPAAEKGKPIPPPTENISAKKHPNLAAAQHHLEEAFNKISAGQAANEWDLEGHAAHAKELIDQANKELKEAALASNKEHQERK